MEVIGVAVTLVLALLGWVYQLGFQGARVNRNESDIKELKKAQIQHERDIRLDIKEGFEGIYKKLDALPCRQPGKDKC